MKGGAWVLVAVACLLSSCGDKLETTQRAIEGSTSLEIGGGAAMPIVIYSAKIVNHTPLALCVPATASPISSSFNGQGLTMTGPAGALDPLGPADFDDLPRVTQGRHSVIVVLPKSSVQGSVVISGLWDFSRPGTYRISTDTPYIDCRDLHRLSNLSSYSDSWKRLGKHVNSKAELNVSR